ncbi:hypothetical protein A4A49_07955 [Nicotiana attenuata]|uniref:VOC domain-containing protein n=1 Tax=Nicotiana attenuata TaxID=49451 RepID=A0A1J6IKZ4_NICAT|nr:hypothetical protein A4A49_07955 [Nicotiana attenuata]
MVLGSTTSILVIAIVVVVLVALIREASTGATESNAALAGADALETVVVILGSATTILVMAVVLVIPVAAASTSLAENNAASASGANDNVEWAGKEDAPSKKGKINPKDNHISFQCSDMNLIIQRLDEMKIEYVTATVKEGGVTVDQLIFHDPDGNMIEICNCQNIPILPLSSCPLKKFNKYPTFNQTMPNSFHGNGTSKMNCLGEMEYLMLENLAMNLIDISY